jgi:hypothetical protein
MKMVLDLTDPATLGRLTLLMILLVMAAAVGYAKGFKDGNREGWARRRSFERHVSRKAVK